MDPREPNSRMRRETIDLLKICDAAGKLNAMIREGKDSSEQHDMLLNVTECWKELLMKITFTFHRSTATRVLDTLHNRTWEMARPAQDVLYEEVYKFLDEVPPAAENKGAPRRRRRFFDVDEEDSKDFSLIGTFSEALKRKGLADAAARLERILKETSLCADQASLNAVDAGHSTIVDRMANLEGLVKLASDENDKIWKGMKVQIAAKSRQSGEERKSSINQKVDSDESETATGERADTPPDYGYHPASLVLHRRGNNLRGLLEAQTSRLTQDRILAIMQESERVSMLGK